MTQSKGPNLRVALAAFASLWLLGIAGGSWLMLRHEFEPGADVAAPSSILDVLRPLVDAAPEKLTVVMAVHPECPCTRASLEQLDRAMAQSPGKIQAVALFWVDEAEPDASLDGNRSWRRVAEMPGAHAVRDPGGRLASRLGASVSGSVAAYDGAGRLRFQGGLTPSRGHAGSSLGMDLIRELANGGNPADAVAAAPAFGCSLQGEAETLP